MSIEDILNKTLEKEIEAGLTELQAKYRMVFSDTFGRDVLSDILMECHYGDHLDINNPAQIAVHNVGTMILAKMGIYSENTRNDVINALLSVRPKKTEVSHG